MDNSRIDAVVTSEGRRVELSMLLDSEQMHTCLPEEAWQQLGLAQKRRQLLERADGTTTWMGISDCTVELEMGSVATPVILGGPRDLPILVVLTLAELGFLLDPLSPPSGTLAVGQ